MFDAELAARDYRSSKSITAGGLHSGEPAARDIDSWTSITAVRLQVLSAQRATINLCVCYPVRASLVAIKCCPLPYSVPLGSSANLTARHEVRLNPKILCAYARVHVHMHACICTNVHVHMHGIYTCTLEKEKKRNFFAHSLLLFCVGKFRVFMKKLLLAN